MNEKKGFSLHSTMLRADLKVVWISVQARIFGTQLNLVINFLFTTTLSHQKFTIKWLLLYFFIKLYSSIKREGEYLNLQNVYQSFEVGRSFAPMELVVSLGGIIPGGAGKGIGLMISSMENLGITLRS